MLYSDIQAKLVRSALPMNTKHLKSGFLLILLSLVFNPVAQAYYGLSKAEMSRVAHERAQIRFSEQIRTAMDELFFLDAAFTRLGYPTEEKKILGKTFVIWRAEGPEVQKSSWTILASTWSSSTGTSRSSSAIYEPTFGNKPGPVFQNTIAETSSRGTSATSTKGGSTSFGKGRAIRYKIQCTITLEVDEQKRVKGWQFTRNSDLDYCVQMLNIKPTFAELVDQEMVKAIAAKKAGIVYVKIRGCESKAPSQRNAPAAKIAIFPFDSDSSCLGQNRPTQEKVASTLRTVVENNDSLRLTYSYYDKAPNDPLRNNVDEVWLGDVSKKPNVPFLYHLGRQLDVDAVLISWRPAAGVGYCTNRMPPYTIELYLIDVKSQCTLFVEGDEARLKNIAEQFFRHFLKGPAKPSAVSENKK